MYTDYQKIRSVIERALNAGKSNFIIYPYGEYGAMTKQILNDSFGIKEAGIIDNHLSQFNSSIKSLSDYQKDKIEYTVLFTCANPDVYEEVLNNLRQYFAQDEVIEIFEIHSENRSDCMKYWDAGYYEDSQGNRIIGRYEGLRLVFSGFNAKVEIGENVRFNQTVMYVHNNGKITIGNNVCFDMTSLNIQSNAEIAIGQNAQLMRCSLDLGEDVFCEIETECVLGIEEGWNISAKRKSSIVFSKGVRVRGSLNDRWILNEGARLTLGCRSWFNSGIIWLGENAQIKIGEDFSIGRGYYIVAPPDTLIDIGDDCLFSNNVGIRSNDGHSIFDVISGENINTTDAIRKARKILIGNHVWVGTDAIILYNTWIREGSIIGAASLVKSKVPNNCIAAGIPAKVVRENIAWSRAEYAKDMAECGEKYCRLTETEQNTGE